MTDSIVLHGMELPSKATAHADVSNISSLDDVVKCLHGFFDWRFRVKSMALKNIYVVELESFQGVFDGFKNMLK
jgi:hypothetical protein